MNFRTESFDFPQNEQRRCLSCDMADSAEAQSRAEVRGAPGAAGDGRGARSSRPAEPVERLDSLVVVSLDRRCLRGNDLRSTISPRCVITLSIRP